MHDVIPKQMLISRKWALRERMMLKAQDISALLVGRSRGSTRGTEK